MENNTDNNQMEVLGQTGVIDTVAQEPAPNQEKVHKMDLKTLFALGLGVVLLIVIAIILIMKFTGQKLTVTFDTDGGSKIASITVRKGSAATKPKNPTKEDYTFVEWQLDGKKYSFNQPVNKNITLKAKWEVKLTDDIYTITFNSSGGTEVDSQQVHGNGTVILPEEPTKPHYKFSEWQLDGKKYDFETLVKSDLTLTAKWEALPSYTVKIDFDGGSSNYSEVVYEGELVKRPNDPKKAGYKFKEWQKDGEAYNFETPVMSDFTLKAIYEQATTYNVSFDTDGGSFIETQKVEEDTVIVKPKDPTKEGYTFAGWQLNGKDFDLTTPITGDITLKAKWTQKAEVKMCKVVFVYDGSEDIEKTIELECGTKVSSANKKFYETFKNICQSAYENNSLNSNNCLETASLDSDDFEIIYQNGKQDAIINSDGKITFWFMNYGN